MATNGHLHDRLIRLLRDRLHLDVPSADTDLVETGLMDSLQFVQLVLHLEEDFGIHISLEDLGDRKSTRLNSSHSQISYAVFCLKKKKNKVSVALAQATMELLLTSIDVVSL